MVLPKCPAASGLLGPEGFPVKSCQIGTNETAARYEFRSAFHVSHVCHVVQKMVYGLVYILGGNHELRGMTPADDIRPRHSPGLPCRQCPACRPAPSR